MIQLELSEEEIRILQAAMWALDIEFDKGDGPLLFRECGIPFPKWREGMGEERYERIYEEAFRKRESLTQKLKDALNEASS